MVTNNEAPIDRRRYPLNGQLVLITAVLINYD